jgi:hypothetical protein
MNPKVPLLHTASSVSVMGAATDFRKPMMIARPLECPDDIKPLLGRMHRFRIRGVKARPLRIYV